MCIYYSYFCDIPLLPDLLHSCPDEVTQFWRALAILSSILFALNSQILPLPESDFCHKAEIRVKLNLTQQLRL